MLTYLHAAAVHHPHSACLVQLAVKFTLSAGACAGVTAKVIYSGGADLDILPQHASKGKGLEFLLGEVRHSPLHSYRLNQTCPSARHTSVQQPFLSLYFLVSAPALPVM